MKLSYTLLIALIFTAGNLTAAENNFIVPDFITNPYNDEEIILTGNYQNGAVNWIITCVVDLENNTTIHTELEINHVANVVVEGNSKKVAYISNNDAHIYDYTDLSKISTVDHNEKLTDVSFSSNGENLYIFNKSSLSLYTYEVSTGNLVGELVINSNPTLFSNGYLNGGKDELALKNNNSLEIWDIQNKELNRTITLPNDVELIEFRDEGNKISCKRNKEVYIIDSETGNVLYNKEFDFNIEKLDFTANMQFMIIGRSYIYDIDADSAVTDIPKFNTSHNFDSPYNFITSDLKKILGSQDLSLYCGRYAEMPVQMPVYFVYDTETSNKLVSVPEGFIPTPSHATISNNSDMVLITGSDRNFNDSIFTNALVSSDEEFIKYIHVNMVPMTFAGDSKYLVFMDGSILKLYDIEIEEFEREFETGITDHEKVYYIGKDGGRLIIANSERVKIFNYQDFSLEHEIDLDSKGIEVEELICDLEGNISIYKEGEIVRINAYTGELTEENLANVPDGYNFEDITNNGRFLLFGKDNSKIIVYDTWEQEIILTHNETDDIKEYSTLKGRGFFGNHQIIWYSYEPNPMEPDPILKTYDLVNDTKEKLRGERRPEISMDGKLFYSYYCPTDYVISSIRDKVISVEETTNNFKYNISPNPATDYIELELDKVNKGSNLKIFDTFGKVVKNVNVQTISNKIKININELPPGVYFIEIGGTVQKFVKM